MKYKQLFHLTLVILIFSAFFSGCTEPSSKINSSVDEKKTIIIKDMAGRTVEIPEKVERVVAVGAGTLRQIAYLGAMDLVVGVESYEKENTTLFYAPYRYVYFEKMSSLPEVGPAHGGKPELIAGAEPDIILYGFVTGGPVDADSYQTKTGIPVVCVDVGDMASDGRDLMYQSWDLLGKILDKEERASELREYADLTINDLNVRTKDIPKEKRPVVFPGALSYKTGRPGILSTQYPFASLEFVNARHALAEGGVDTKNVPSTAFSVNQENLLEWDPDMIFIDLSNLGEVSADFNRTPSYSELKAVRNGNVYGFLPVSAYRRNYENVLINAYHMGSVMYPEQFSDVVFDEKADEIYSAFLGKKLNKDIVENIGGNRKLSL